MPDLQVPVGKDRTVNDIRITAQKGGVTLDSDTNIVEVGGQSQSAVDMAAEIAALASAVAAHDGSDHLLFEENSPLDVSGATVTVTDDGNLTIAGTVDASASEIDVDVATQSLASLTVTDDGSLSVAAVNDAVAIEDSTGAQIDPAVATDYFDSQTTGHDLVGSGDLTVGPGAVDRGAAVTIAATSTDNNTFSVSVDWQDSSGNVFQTESAADIGLDTITEDYARLVRKAPQVSITVTDESGATQNTVNVHADTER